MWQGEDRVEMIRKDSGWRLAVSELLLLPGKEWLSQESHSTKHVSVYIVFVRHTWISVVSAAHTLPLW